MKLVIDIPDDEYEKIMKKFPACSDGVFSSAWTIIQHGTPIVDWIFCLDRMPEKNKKVFVYLFDNSPYIAWWDGERWHTKDFILDKDYEPLEWCELPKQLDGEK